MMVTPESRARVSPNAFKDLLTKLKSDPDLEIESDVRNTGKILFKNGVYDCDLQQTISDKPTEYMWATVNCNYIPNSEIEDAPVFEKFIQSSLDYGYDMSKTCLLLEIVGYGVSDYTCGKAAFNLIGQPNSGKSVMLEVIRGLLPEDQTTQINFSDIGNRFSTGLLRDSRINLSSEISEAEFPSIAHFKAITACDSVMGENKCEHK